MLASVIKSRFLTIWDQFESVYISPAKMTDIFWSAQNDVVVDLQDRYQIDNRITDDTIYIAKKVSVATSTNLINISSDIPNNDFSSLITVKPTYTVGGIVYSFQATPLLASEENSYYARGTVNAPKYKFYSNSSNERILEILPTVTSAIVISNAEITYFTDPVAIDFTIPDYDIFITDNVAENIINKAIQIASSAFRDRDEFQTSTVLLTDSNKNP